MPPTKQSQSAYNMGNQWDFFIRGDKIYMESRNPIGSVMLIELDPTKLECTNFNFEMNMDILEHMSSHGSVVAEEVTNNFVDISMGFKAIAGDDAITILGSKDELPADIPDEIPIRDLKRLIDSVRKVRF